MKKLLVLAVIFAASSAYAPAFAGGCGGGGGAASKSGGFDCSNPCPLAQAANTRRSLGDEAVACSAVVRAKLTASVLLNLAKI